MTRTVLGRSNMKIDRTRSAALLATALCVASAASHAQRTNDQVMGDSARGAARGAVIGAVAGDAGKGAAAGAVGGAVFGGARRATPDTVGGDALRGAAIGAVAGDAGKGAAAGALMGGIRRSRR